MRADNQASGAGVIHDFGDHIRYEAVAHGGGALDALLAHLARGIFEDEAGVSIQP
jgi:hypothetical protein